MNTKKIYFTLGLGALIDHIGFGIIIPLMPFYALKFGASAITITLLFSTYSLMQFLFLPLWSRMIDRIGRRPMLLLSLSGGIVAYLWLSMANSLWMLFACRAFEGMMTGSFLVAMVYVADITTNETRAKGMGIIGTAAMLGICFGPAIGGMLVGADPQNPNFILPPLFAAGFSLFGLIVTWFTLPESKPSHIPTKLPAQKHPFSITEIKDILSPPPTHLLMLLFFAIPFAMVGTHSILAIWIQKQFNWGGQQVAFIFLFWGVVACISSAFLIAPLNKKFGEANILFSMSVLLCFGLFLIPFSNNTPLLLGSILLVSFSSSILKPLMSSMLCQSVGALRQSRILGFSETIIIVAMVVSPIWGGFLFGTVGPSWPFWSSSMMVFIASCVAWQVATTSRLSTASFKHRQRKMMRLFNLMDHDKNGFIEPLDFEQAVKTIADINGLQIGSPDYWLIHSFWTGLGEKLQTLVDTDGDGRITPDEWQEYMSKRLDSDFADAFLKMIDSDGTGKIDISEIKMFYQAYKINTNQAKFSEENSDIDQDGHIPPEEIKKCLEQFMYRDETKVFVEIFQ